MNSTHLQKQFLAWTIIFFVSCCASLGAQTRPVAILGGTLIDGTGSAPVEDAAIVIQGGRIQQVGKRAEVSVPQGAEVIEAGGKTILPGLVDGHCHYREWAGELLLALGVTTCPVVSGQEVEYMVAQREATQKGEIRGPRLWFAGPTIDGPPPPYTSEARKGRSDVVVRTPEEARKAVRDQVEKGVDGLKFYEYLTPELAKAAADEAHQLGRAVIGHSLDVSVAADAGYDSVEHFWAAVYSSAENANRRTELDTMRNSGQTPTGEFHTLLQPESFDRIIRVLVDNNVHWNPTWGSRFRQLSRRAAALKQQELALLQDSRFSFPSLTAETVEARYSSLEEATPQKRAQLLEGYRKLEDFVRRFAAAGGKIHAGSDANQTTPPGFPMHVELQLLVDAGLTPVQAIQAASLNVAEAWRKDQDYGSVEKGKVADMFIVRGDPRQDMAVTQNVEMVFLDGKLVGGSSYTKP